MLDYVDVESDLSEKERMVHDTAREFVEETIKPEVGQHWIEGTHDIHSLIIGHDLTGIPAFT